MSNHEWDALAAQWESQEVGDPALLQRRLRRHMRWNHLGLLGEVVGLVSALAVMAWAWKGAPELRVWLIPTAVLLVACQGLYVYLRRRYRLFGTPGSGLVGLIDAELARARFIMASHWAGLPIGLAIVGLAWALMPSVEHEKLLEGALVGAALYLPYLAGRTWQMLRRVRRLQQERARLLE